jgi:hypothetical protein
LKKEEEERGAVIEQQRVWAAAMLGPPIGMRGHAAAGRPAPREALRPGASRLEVPAELPNSLTSLTAWAQAPSLQVQVPSRQGHCCKGTLVYEEHPCTCHHCSSLEADTSTPCRHGDSHEGFTTQLYVHVQRRPCPGRRQPCLQHFHSCTRQLHLLWKRPLNQQTAPRMLWPAAHSVRV